MTAAGWLSGLPAFLYVEPRCNLVMHSLPRAWTDALLAPRHSQNNLPNCPFTSDRKWQQIRRTCLDTPEYCSWRGNSDQKYAPTTDASA